MANTNPCPLTTKELCSGPDCAACALVAATKAWRLAHLTAKLADATKRGEEACWRRGHAEMILSSVRENQAYGLISEAREAVLRAQAAVVKAVDEIVELNSAIANE